MFGNVVKQGLSCLICCIVAHHSLKRRSVITGLEKEFWLADDYFQIGKLMFTITRRNNDFRPRPHYAGRIWKRSFISIQLGLPSTLIRHENGDSPKRSSNRRNLKRRLSLLVWTENILKTRLFENDDVTIIMMFLCPSFPQAQIQNDRRLVRLQIAPA